MDLVGVDDDRNEGGCGRGRERELSHRCGAALALVDLKVVVLEQDNGGEATDAVLTAQLRGGQRRAPETSDKR